MTCPITLHRLEEKFVRSLVETRGSSPVGSANEISRLAIIFGLKRGLDSRSCFVLKCVRVTCIEKSTMNDYVAMPFVPMDGLAPGQAGGMSNRSRAAPRPCRTQRRNDCLLARRRSECRRVEDSVMLKTFGELSEDFERQ